MKDAGKFILNGLMLSAVSLILRTAGVSFNAYVTSEIGAAGTGLFTLVMSVYSPALTLATAGVNLAVSRLTAEELGKGNAVSARSVLNDTVQPWCFRYSRNYFNAAVRLYFFELAWKCFGIAASSHACPRTSIFSAFLRSKRIFYRCQTCFKKCCCSAS